VNETNKGAEAQRIAKIRRWFMRPTMSVVGFDYDYEFDETIALVEVWYDHESKIWTIQFKNANGDQIGAADYAHMKSQAIKTAKTAMAGKGAPIHVTDRTTGKTKTITPEAVPPLPPVETALCVDCGVDTRINGYVNRVPRDTGIIDGYNCGSCNDAYEAAQGLDHTLYEKYEKARHTEIDAMFPDAPAFREWCQRDTNENLSDEDKKQIQALVDNYRYEVNR